MSIGVTIRTDRRPRPVCFRDRPCVAASERHKDGGEKKKTLRRTATRRNNNKVLLLFIFFFFKHTRPKKIIFSVIIISYDCIITIRRKRLLKKKKKNTDCSTPIYARVIMTPNACVYYFLSAFKIIEEEKKTQKSYTVIERRPCDILSGFCSSVTTRNNVY